MKLYVKFTRAARVTRYARKFNLRRAIVFLREMYTEIQKVAQKGLKCVLEPLYNNLIRVLNMTLNNYIDDILLEARNNNIGESEKLSRHQIQLWIKSYRAMLIKQKLDRKEPLDDMFTQTIRMHVDKIENDPGHYEYVGDQELPTLLNTKNFTGLIQVKDAYGNIIQIGSETKMKFQKYRKYTCKDYIAYKKEDRVYVEGDSNTLEYIDVKVIAEDPTESKLCYDPSKDEYPIPVYMWPTIKDLIFSKDFYTLSIQRSDMTNNTKDDNQNNYNPNLYRNRRR